MADGMTPAEAATLYGRDFLGWTRDQAAALRAAAEGRPAALDWLNLAEEIESLGRRDLRELRSRVATIIEHLLKLEVSSAAEPRAGWRQTVRRERREIASLLADSPSLRRHLEEAVSDGNTAAAGDAFLALKERGEATAAAGVALRGRLHAVDQVLGEEWWPDSL